MFEENTDNETLQVNFIKTNRLQNTKRIVGLIPRHIECINYLDIYNKMIKDDDTEPSDSVISIHIIKKLNEYLVNRHENNICYVLDISDENIYDNILNIMEIIRFISPHSIIKYTLIYDNDNIPELFVGLKDNLKFIKYEVSQSRRNL